jgi:ribosomal protein S18 acetylase RimI-like enzyme
MSETARPRVTIRMATSPDNGLLANLGAETFADAFGADNTPENMRLYLSKCFAPDVQAAELADPFTLFLIAEIEGEPAGYARLREGGPPAALSASRPLEIVRFYARARWIGRGVGAALMRATLREAHARGCDAIWLDVWERNPRAIDFYRKWGFMEFGAQPFRLGNDVQRDLLMARPVSLPKET